MTASTDPTTQSSGTAAGQGRSIGELVVDLVLVGGIGYYLWIAHSYPPDGREIPTVVGVVALIAAAVQLIGWFVPGMWTFTHGNATEERREPAVVAGAIQAGAVVGETTAPAVAGARAAEPVDEVPSSGHDSRTFDVSVAMAWAAGFVAAILLVGYLVSIPLFFLAYFAAARSWKLAIASAVVMGLVTKLLFEVALGIPLPGGLLF
jgi:hypothetical protein